MSPTFMRTRPYLTNSPGKTSPTPNGNSGAPPASHCRYGDRSGWTENTIACLAYPGSDCTPRLLSVPSDFLHPALSVAVRVVKDRCPQSLGGGRSGVTTGVPVAQLLSWPVSTRRRSIVPCANPTAEKSQPRQPKPPALMIWSLAFFGSTSKFVKSPRIV